MSGAITIEASDLDRFENWCRVCIVRVGEYTITLEPEGDFPNKPFRLCADHMKSLRDTIDVALVAIPIEEAT